MPLLPFSSFPLTVRLALIFTLFALLQSLRLLLRADIWVDAAMQAVLAPLLYYIVIGWKLRREYVWPRSPVTGIQGFLSGIVAGGLFFFLLFFTVSEDVGDVKMTGLSITQTTLLVPVVEEIYFRLVLTGAMQQAGLARHWTIVLSGLFFALSHDYSVAPFLFPVGLAAGWLFLRFGVIASLSMHVVYNLAILLHAMS